MGGVHGYHPKFSLDTIERFTGNTLDSLAQMKQQGFRLFSTEELIDRKMNAAEFDVRGRHYDPSLCKQARERREDHAATWSDVQSATSDVVLFRKSGKYKIVKGGIELLPMVHQFHEVGEAQMGAGVYELVDKNFDTREFSLEHRLPSPKTKEDAHKDSALCFLLGGEKKVKEMYENHSRLRMWCHDKNFDEATRTYGGTDPNKFRFGFSRTFEIHSDIFLDDNGKFDDKVVLMESIFVQKYEPGTVCDYGIRSVYFHANIPVLGTMLPQKR